MPGSPPGPDQEGQRVRRLVQLARAGAWPASEAEGSLTLGFGDRNRRRIRLTTDDGEAVLLDLPTAAALADGDGLAFEGGGWLLVHAAAEDVLDIEADDPTHLARLAWHLGNQHLPTEVGSGRLRIAYDHVIEAMVRELGARCTRRRAPFQPEAGAYAGGHHHA
jgi:urease accessory protein